MHTLESTQTSARTRTPSFCFIIRFDFIWFDCCVAVVICHYCAFRMPINSDNIRYKWIQNVSPIGLRFIQELPGSILSASAWVSIAEWILKIISSMVLSLWPERFFKTSNSYSNFLFEIMMITTLYTLVATRDIDQKNWRKQSYSYIERGNYF